MSEHSQVLLITQSDTAPGQEGLYREYLQKTVAIMGRYGGKVVFVGTGLENRSATRRYGNNAVLSFPGKGVLEAFLADPDYRAVQALQKAAVVNLHTAYFTPRPPASASPEAVARRAFEQFRQGLATGSWGGFLGMLTDDFTFSFPKGKFAGEHHGQDKAAAFFAYVSEVYAEGLHVTGLHHVAVSGNTVFFEFEDEGKLFGKPYYGRVVVAFDVRQDKLCGYREYFGSDGAAREAKA